MARTALIAALWLATAGVAHAQGIETLKLNAPQLDNESVNVEIYLPPKYDVKQSYPVLYINDGQDMQAVHLQAHLRDYYAQPNAKPWIVVAVPMFKDRMGVYGLADRTNQRAEIAPTKYGDVGTKSYAYNQWFTQTLIPAIDAKYATQRNAEGRAVLGWSLGAVAAFSLGWQYPEEIGAIGMFSPSLWLSEKRGTADEAQQTRLVQNRVANDPSVPQTRIYLAIGTREDKDDRDGDGVNDAVDDVFDLVNGWRDMQGLRQRGIASETTLLVGGEHNQAAWSAMLPRFMRWLTPRDVK